MVLPRPVREAMRLSPGDTLEIESDGDRIIISPVRVRAGLQKERGIWVYRSGMPESTPISDLIDQERERRTHDLAGNRP